MVANISNHDDNYISSVILCQRLHVYGFNTFHVFLSVVQQPREHGNKSLHRTRKRRTIQMKASTSTMDLYQSVLHDAQRSFTTRSIKRYSWFAHLQVKIGWMCYCQIHMKQQNCNSCTRLLHVHCGPVRRVSCVEVLCQLRCIVFNLGLLNVSVKLLCSFQSYPMYQLSSFVHSRPTQCISQALVSILGLPNVSVKLLCPF